MRKGPILAVLAVVVACIFAVRSHGQVTSDRPHDIEISARALGNAIRLTQDVFGPESDSDPVLSETRLGLCRGSGSPDVCRMDWYVVEATATDTASAHSSGLLGVIGMVNGQSAEEMTAKLQSARIHVVKLTATVVPHQRTQLTSESDSLPAVLLDLVNASLLADSSRSPLSFRGSFNRGAHALGLQTACGGSALPR